ncbi:hypothetical protein GCM10010349_16580 [Streptomyces flavofungini]|nr:hypothetical protein GCM10010349_16580 [Streptomyces flavofungini]
MHGPAEGVEALGSGLQGVYADKRHGGGPFAGPCGAQAVACAPSVLYILVGTDALPITAQALTSASGESIK